jgi:hypothetical protein
MSEETEQANLDLLVGAKAISEFVLGTPEKAKSIYPLRKELGLFYLGGELVGRRGKLRERIEAKEEEAAAAAKAANAAT